MKPHRLVIFAYHYPPEDAVGGLRPSRFVKYLTRMGYRCHVITAAEQHESEDDTIEYLPDPFQTTSRATLGWQAERVARKLFAPGVTGLRWSIEAAKAARRWLDSTSGGPATILSSFPPHGTHIAGWRLAVQTGLPWIADFRDPLGDSPGQDDIYQFQRNLYLWLEARTLPLANVIIANTDSAGERLHRKYPHVRDRIHVLWNGFDPENRTTPLPPTDPGICIISHVGELYAGRVITGLLESFDRLFTAGLLSPAQFRLLLAGPSKQDCLPSHAFLERAAAAGWLSVDNVSLPRPRALELTRQSAGLLLVQPQSTIQVPAKLYEYIQIGRPVLAYVPRETPVERILSQSEIPYRCIYTNASPEENDRTTLEFCSLVLSGASGTASAYFEQTFNVVNQTATLDRIIRSLNRS